MSLSKPERREILISLLNSLEDVRHNLREFRFSEDEEDVEILKSAKEIVYSEIYRLKRRSAL